jgi:hypothetical protein
MSVSWTEIAVQHIVWERGDGGGRDDPIIRIVLGWGLGSLPGLPFILDRVIFDFNKRTDRC